MKSIKYIVVMLIMSFVSYIAEGKRINRDVAYSYAQQFTCANTVISRSGSGLELACSNNNYYVFNYTNGGFVIVSGSDNTETILGYSDSGKFDTKNLPDNFKYYLDNCDNYIDYVENNNISTKKVRSRNDGEKTNIKPLIKSKWGQGYPYNNYCPEIDGLKCPTGCVATALAQIFAYYKYPTNGVDMSYVDPATNIYYEKNLDSCYVDYTKFLISYNGSETSTQIDAIAKFMRMCGTIVSVKYKLTGSSAYTQEIYNRLPEYWNYDSETSYITKGNKTTEWEDSIYDSLNNKCPVVYNGNGHCWICDGYEDGYYHMNWGWGGQCDGYYNLNAIYLGNNNYTYKNNAIINLHPKEFVANKSITNIIPISSISVNSNTVNIDIYNPSIYDANLEYGYITVNQNNDSTFTSYSNLNVESNNTTTVSLNLDDINALNNDEICTIIPAIKYDKKYIPTINNTDTIYSIKTEYKSLFVNSLSNIDNIINSIYADNFKINKLPDYTIHLDAVNNKFPITIFDLTGNLIYKGTDNNIKLNKPGFYILKHNNIKTSFVINN